ncbi:hypothetical protein HXX76_009370 [Chlamydomonas incerta]|uniref:Uncharacterized protein n=1 Tax=Chlamydomonas incerta TaxID=51695 RepID=A0A835VWF2_CHLIN|nr:hypothetical protein HXX76_009370 [Chlamydomonas incerta]|eukprot:KAG2431877.1 hypothetical protein HXX76_009370 [Chlamydomonas incerta]
MGLSPAQGNVSSSPAAAAADDWGVTFVCPPAAAGSNTSLLLHDSVVADLPLSPVGALVTFVNCSRVAIVDSAFERLSAAGAAASAHGAVMVVGSNITETLYLLGTNCSRVHGASGFACVLAASMITQQQDSAAVIIRDSRFINNSVSAALIRNRLRVECIEGTTTTSLASGGYGALLVYGVRRVTVHSSQFGFNRGACGGAVSLIGGGDASSLVSSGAALTLVAGGTLSLVNGDVSSLISGSGLSSLLSGGSGSAGGKMDMDVQGTSAFNNTANNGAVFFVGAQATLTATFTASTMVNNTAWPWGGVFYLAARATLALALHDGSQMNDNDARWGGVVYMAPGSTLSTWSLDSGSSVSRNRVYFNGAVIYMSAESALGTWSLDGGSSVNGNSAYSGSSVVNGNGAYGGSGLGGDGGVVRFG